MRSINLLTQLFTYFAAYIEVAGARTAAGRGTGADLQASAHTASKYSGNELQYGGAAYPVTPAVTGVQMSHAPETAGPADDWIGKSFSQKHIRHAFIRKVRPLSLSLSLSVSFSSPHIA